MATDLEKLVVQLSADYKQYEKAMQRASGVMNKQAREIEKRWSSTNKRLSSISSSMASSITAPLAGIGAALSIREVARYADAWTQAKNQIAAASSVAGMQGRSLEGINKIATSTRAGISETADLYSKLLRSTAGVAKSEEDVAKATEIVNKAFKAGGAATSEQVAGILQLSQGLGSGLLQGDELRSVRENAPLLAQAIADYYKVNIAGLKKLGENGQITSEGVFKAILAAQPKIDAAFGATSQTIADGVTKVQNAFTQYIGQTDSGLGATVRLTQGLNALADNFENIADVTVKVASIIAAGVLGRSIGGMIAKLGLAGVAAQKFIVSMRAATTLAGVTTALGGLTAAAAPIATVIGVAAVGAMVAYSAASKKSEASTNLVNSEIERLGLVSTEAAKAVDAVSKAVESIPADDKAKMLAALNDEIDRLRNGGGGFDSPMDFLKWAKGPDADTLAGVEKQAEWGQTAGGRKMSGFKSGDTAALKTIQQMVEQFRNMQISADDVSAKVAELSQTDLSGPAKELLAVMGQVAQKTEAAQSLQIANGDLTAVDDAKEKIIDLRDELTMTKVAFDGWSIPLVKEVGDIIDSFTEGKTSAAETQAALEKVADANPQAQGYIAQVTPILGVLQQIIDKANLAKLSMQIGSGGYAPDLGRFPNPYAEYEQQYKNNSYIKEQVRLQGLTKDQLALEKEIVQVRKDAAASGATLTEDQVKSVAAGNLAADARRSGEGKKANRSGEGKKAKPDKAGSMSSADRARQKYDDSTRTDIAGMKAETEQYIALSGTYDAYGLSIQRAAKEAELLQALENKGVTITPQLREQVKGLADEWYNTAEANAYAKARYEEFQQSFSDAKSTLSDAFTGLVTGAESFGDALSNILSKLAEMAASKAFESLWSSSGGDDWLVSGLKALGFSSGGYTGAGGKNDPAGIVHKGEVVWSQRDIAKAGGVGVVEAMRRNGGAIPGYASGGVVDMPSIALPAQLRTGGQSTGAQPVQTSVAVEPSPYFDVRVSQISGGVTQRGLRANSKTLGRQNQNFQMRGTT